MNNCFNSCELVLYKVPDDLIELARYNSSRAEEKIKQRQAMVTASSLVHSFKQSLKTKLETNSYKRPRSSNEDEKPHSRIKVEIDLSDFSDDGLEPLDFLLDVSDYGSVISHDDGDSTDLEIAPQEIPPSRSVDFRLDMTRLRKKLDSSDDNSSSTEIISSGSSNSFGSSNSSARLKINEFRQSGSESKEDENIMSLSSLDSRNHQRAAQLHNQSLDQANGDELSRPPLDIPINESPLELQKIEKQKRETEKTPDSSVIVPKYSVPHNGELPTPHPIEVPDSDGTCLVESQAPQKQKLNDFIHPRYEKSFDVCEIVAPNPFFYCGSCKRSSTSASKTSVQLHILKNPRCAGARIFELSDYIRSRNLLESQRSAVMNLFPLFEEAGDYLESNRKPPERSNSDPAQNKSQFETVPQSTLESTPTSTHNGQLFLNGPSQKRAQLFKVCFENASSGPRDSHVDSKKLAPSAGKNRKKPKPMDECSDESNASPTPLNLSESNESGHVKSPSVNDDGGHLKKESEQKPAPLQLEFFNQAQRDPLSPFYYCSSCLRTSKCASESSVRSHTSQNQECLGAKVLELSHFIRIHGLRENQRSAMMSRFPLFEEDCLEPNCESPELPNSKPPQIESLCETYPQSTHKSTPIPDRNGNSAFREASQKHAQPSKEFSELNEGKKCALS